MLVGRLQIHVGRIAQRGMSRANRLMGNAAVDPDVDRVVAMARALGQPERLRERDVVELEPDVGAALVATRSASLRIHSGLRSDFAFGGIEDGQRNTPAALAGNDPIGPGFDRAGDAILAPRGSQVTLVMAWSASLRRSSMRMKNCSTARKMIGVFERQQ